MKKWLTITSIFKRTKKASPKQRVREFMEAGSGHKWALEKDEDDNLLYVSKERGKPGLCLYFDGNATLSPETRIRRFDYDKGDFFFDDPPEQVEVFSGKGANGEKHLPHVELKKALHSFLEKWLAKSKWVYKYDKLPEGDGDGDWVRWYFKHMGTDCPMVAVGEIEISDMPSGYQINIEKLMEVDKTEVDKTAKYVLCISLILKN